MPYKDPAKQREWQKRWKQRNAQNHALAIKDSRMRMRDDRVRRVNVLKENTPCVDCGSKFPAVCMDFDHRGDDAKVQDVSAMAWSGLAWKTIEAEIAKCDLVCANCHRIRTHITRKQVAA